MFYYFVFTMQLILDSNSSFSCVLPDTIAKTVIPYCMDYQEYSYLSTELDLPFLFFNHQHNQHVHRNKSSFPFAHWEDS